jgi:hypothetical protein
MALSVTAGVSRLVGKYTLRPRQNHVQWAQHTKQGRSRAFNSQLLTSPDEEPTGEALTPPSGDRHSRNALQTSLKCGAIEIKASAYSPKLR